MNYKTMLICALLAGSMQQAWGMDAEAAKKAKLENERKVELEKSREEFAHKHRVMKQFKHEVEQGEMQFDSNHWAFFAGLYQVKE